MEQKQIMAALEAILFAMGNSVEIAQLAAALEVSEEEIIEAAGALSEQYRERGSGIAINRYDDAFQLSTRPDQYKYLIRIAKTPKKQVLTDTLLETLSIIAFRQPVTKLEIQHIRGVNSDYAVNKLVSYELVQEVGRKEAPGSPILFGTTEQFLRTFGLSSVEDIPPLEPVKVEEFREEAEEEVSENLKV